MLRVPLNLSRSVNPESHPDHCEWTASLTRYAIAYTVTVLEFASGRVDRRSELESTHLNLFMNISRGVRHFRQGIEPPDPHPGQLCGRYWIVFVTVFILVLEAPCRRRRCCCCDLDSTRVFSWSVGNIIAYVFEKVCTANCTVLFCDFFPDWVASHAGAR